MESLWLLPISLSSPFAADSSLTSIPGRRKSSRVEMLHSTLFFRPSYQTDIPREDDNCDELMDSSSVDGGVGFW